MTKNFSLLRSLSAATVALSFAAAAFAQPPAAEPAKPSQPPAATPAAPAPAPAAKPQETEKTVQVIMTTSMGDITIELNREKAPISTENFLKYVDEKFYDGTIFHRVIGNFMIQCGAFTPDMMQKPKARPAIKNEWKNGLKNTKYTVAMARTSVADSATSQFFINVQDNAVLDDPRDGAAYAVFGKVTAGTDVVDKIKAVKTGRKSGMEDVPVDVVEIKSVRRVEAKAADPAKKGG